MHAFALLSLATRLRVALGVFAWLLSVESLLLATVEGGQEIEGVATPISKGTAVTLDREVT
jgi:hypothetical protein